MSKINIVNGFAIEFKNSCKNPVVAILFDYRLLAACQDNILPIRSFLNGTFFRSSDTAKAVAETVNYVLNLASETRSMKLKPETTADPTRTTSFIFRHRLQFCQALLQ
jgi:hypothetical protein